MAGESLGRFRLVRKLGSGSHGTVWEAEDPLLSEKVALKVLHPHRMHEPDARERLKREVILARRIVHPGVCRIYDLHEAADTLFITMQFVEGRMLSAVVKDEPLPVARAVTLLRKLSQAVRAAHAAGVVHRDLKPSNVSVGKDDEIIVLDFGIASSHDLGRLTRPGLAVGTLRFLAPEVWKTGTATARSDQFALGVIGYILLTRRMPFPNKEVATEMLQALKEPPAPINELSPSVPRALAAVVERAMSYDPDRRFDDVGAFDDALGRSLNPALEDNTAPEMLLPAAEKTRAAPRAISFESSIPDAVSDDVQLVQGTNTTGVSTQTPVAMPERRPFPVVAAAFAAGVAVVVVGVVAAIASGGDAAVVVDAGAVVAVTVVDAGAEDEAVVVDAGAAVAAVDARAGLDGALKALIADGKVLRPGDNAAWDDALQRAIFTVKKSPPDVAERQLKKSRAALDAVVIDGPFVSAKLTRYNRQADALVARNPSTREKLKPYSNDVIDKLRKGDARGANKALNVAWAVLDKLEKAK